jgi:hypothetical protein
MLSDGNEVDSFVVISVKSIENLFNYYVFYIFL